MKTTLENSYCRPKTEAEWDLLYPNANWLGKYPSEHSHVCWIDGGKYLASWPNENVNLTEIPVQHFIDLIEDSICVWRIEEFGFKELAKGVWSWSDDGHQILISFERELNIMLAYSDQGMIPLCGIQTFTDLLTLIRFLK